MTEMTVPQENMAISAGEDSMRQYIRDIRKFPRLTPEEERQLAMQCVAGDEDAIRKMVVSNLQLVVSVAREYNGRGVPLLDLIQEGSIGLIYAARKFDHTRNVRFSTYATQWIQQGVARCVMHHNGMIRIPHYTAEKMNKVLRVKNELLQQWGREPEMGEIAAYCEMDAEKVQELLSLCPNVCSLDTPVGADGSDELQILIEDLEAPQPQEELVRTELKNTMQQLLSQLTQRQQEILRLHYGMSGEEPWSLEKIAGKLELSKERVRQIERQAMEKLKTMGADFGLEDYLGE